jgi:hypothetical protein
LRELTKKIHQKLSRLDIKQANLPEVLQKLIQRLKNSIKMMIRGQYAKKAHDGGGDSQDKWLQINRQMIL